MTQPPAYLTVEQAAVRACVSESLIYEACRKKKLKHYRPGVNGRGVIRILVEDLDEWMANFRVEVGPQGDDGPEDLEFLK